MVTLCERVWSHFVVVTELVREVREREKAAGITPDPVIDLYMKALAEEVRKTWKFNDVSYGNVPLIKHSGIGVLN